MKPDTIEAPVASPDVLWRLVLAVCVWVVAAFVALWVATETRIGPVIRVIGPTHGIHSGDVVAVVVCAFTAILLSAAILRPSARDRA